MLDADRRPARADDRLQLFRDFAADPLLHREAARILPHEAGQLGNADHAIRCDITNPGAAEKRKNVVFAKTQ